MTIELKLLSSKKETPDGFPLVFEISHKNVRRQISVGFCFPEHFLKDEKSISRHHPHYDILFPIISEQKAKAKKIVLSKIDSIDKAKEIMQKSNFVSEDFYHFAEDLIAEMKLVVKSFTKRGDLKSANRKSGNISVYENALNQFKIVCPTIDFSDINYNQLMRFRRYQEGLGNSKSTIHLYLRTLRTIYNKGILKFDIENKKPFAGTFDNLKIKSYPSKKKSISKSDVIKLENADFTKLPAVERSRDLWLLQFYFGGADLIDIYNIEKKQIRKDRILFSRSKTNTDLPIDLKIHPKARAIINRHISTEGTTVFPWRKDKLGYETFRRNLGKDLIRIQEILEIEILPAGGHLGIKVARHTFGNIAKRKKVNEDLIREIMGHERDEVDNFYKDRFDTQTRDLGLFEVISSFDCTSETFPFEKAN